MAEEQVTRNPRDAEARALLGLFAARLGDGRLAGPELARALAIDPENSDVMRSAAIGFEVMREREKALKALHAAPTYLLTELARNPDAGELSRDARFPGNRKP